MQGKFGNVGYVYRLHSSIITATYIHKRRLRGYVDGARVCRRISPLFDKVLYNGGAMGRALDLRSTGRGFKSCSRQRITTLDKLFDDVLRLGR